MAILSFWSASKKETGQTLSLVAIATYMSVEHNYKTLVIDATLDDDTIERCFWNKKTNIDNLEARNNLNRGKLDIASGTEGLMSAIASNKTTPEIISNYTKVVFKNRLDILLGLKTSSFELHEKNLMMYNELIAAANKYYDLVIVDLPKTYERESVHNILQKSDVVMYTMSQNLKQIDEYIYNKNTIPELKRKNTIPIIGSVNEFSKYNLKNIANYIKEKETVGILYNNGFMEAASEAKISEFFLKTRLDKKAWDRNYNFFETVVNSSKKVMNKFEEIKYGKIMNS